MQSMHCQPAVVVAGGVFIVDGCCTDISAMRLQNNSRVLHKFLLLFADYITNTGRLLIGEHVLSPKHNLYLKLAYLCRQIPHSLEKPHFTPITIFYRIHPIIDTT